MCVVLAKSPSERQRAAYEKKGDIVRFQGSVVSTVIAPIHSDSFRNPSPSDTYSNPSVKSFSGTGSVAVPSESPPHDETCDT